MRSCSSVAVVDSNGTTTRSEGIWAKMEATKRGGGIAHVGAEKGGRKTVAGEERASGNGSRSGRKKERKGKA